MQIFLKLERLDQKFTKRGLSTNILRFSHHNSVWDIQKPPDIKFEVD